MRKFSPRRNISNWSELNKRIVLELISQKRMTGAGLEKIDIYLKTGKLNWKPRPSPSRQIRPVLVMPEFMKQRLAKHEPALSRFEQMPPFEQRRFIEWVSQAKRPETIENRLIQTIEALQENRRLGLK